MPDKSHRKAAKPHTELAPKAREAKRRAGRIGGAVAASRLSPEELSARARVGGLACWRRSKRDLDRLRARLRRARERARKERAARLVA